MQTNKDINELKPYSKNAKKHPENQIKLIAESIKRFGFDSPIIVDKDNVVIAGHGRLEAAKLLGLKDVPTIQKENLTDEEVKAYRLADNKIAESEWDMGLALEDLKGLSDEMFDLTGFDRDLLIEPDEKDDIIPENAPSVSKLGDIWLLGKHRVMCGDSTIKEDVEKLMGGVLADMVFTDPPYNVAYGKVEHPSYVKRSIMNDEMTPDKFLEFCEGFIQNIFSFCNGCIYMCMSCKEWPTIHNVFEKLGGHWSRTIIWVKDRAVMSRADYHTQFEPIAVVNEDVNEEGEPILYGWKKGVRHFFKGGRKQTDIWRIQRPLASREHPTMKPVQLCTRAIVNNTELDGLVLDLFLGSGSTLIACEKTNRICYGMELDPKYVDVIIKRWEDYTQQKAIKQLSKQ